MYNRYIPQSDGTYRRNRVADAPPRTSHPTPPPKQPPTPPPFEPPREPQKPPREPQKPPKESQRPSGPAPKQDRQQTRHQPQNVGSFLKNLLPGDFDTADLIIILLLLLLAGDCEEDRSTAMLTLVLYLFM